MNKDSKLITSPTNWPTTSPTNWPITSPTNWPITCAIIVGAGQGLRLGRDLGRDLAARSYAATGSDTKLDTPTPFQPHTPFHPPAQSNLPKQFIPIHGDKCSFELSAIPFVTHTAIAEVILVYPAGREHEIELVKTQLLSLTTPRRQPNISLVCGGPSRGESVLQGVEHAMKLNAQKLLIHDAARPFVTPALIDRALSSAMHSDCAVPTIPPVDAITKKSKSGQISSLPRDEIGIAQTPQAFSAQELSRALHAHRDRITSIADETEIMAMAGHDIMSFDGDPDNFKITFTRDLIVAQNLMNLPPMENPPMENPQYGRELSMTKQYIYLTGNGFDLHRLATGGPMRLAGVDIESPFHLVGHSDADAVLHALTDAILGAIGDGDIGEHFPPSDETWRGSDSAIFLQDAISRLRSRDMSLVNCDITIISEQPKISPHRAAMKQRIGELTGLAPQRIGLKATTSESRGAIGRQEALAVIATVSIRAPLAIEETEI